MAAPPIFRTPDELLDNIFLRLSTPADLAHASTACASFRRLITDHAFLRRYRALHPPPLIGVVEDDNFAPAQPPHPSAVAARAFAGFDFSCKSFLPTKAGRAWRPLDFLAGRALLGLEEANELDHLQVRELAVCDPVFRRYILLPAVPGDLTVQVPQRGLIDKDTFLAPGEDEEDPLSFRVMCLAKLRSPRDRVLLVFSSLDGQWHALTFDQWSVLDTLNPYEGALVNDQFVDGCFCSHSSFFNKLLLLDTHSMESFAVTLPPELLQCDWDDFVIVEAAQGMLGMLILINYGHNDDDDGPYRLVHAILRNNQWHLEKVIPLPEKYDVSLLDVAGGYLLIQADYTTSSQKIRKSGFFSIDIKTLQVELFGDDCFGGDLYAGFPPSLCTPTISSDADAMSSRKKSWFL